MFDALNFCMLFLKHYIYKSRINGIAPNFIDFKQKLKRRLDTEKFLMATEQKEQLFLQQWQAIYGELST